MADAPQKSTPRRRWRLTASILAIAAIAYLAWSTQTWLDPRFVGAWRVTSSKLDHEYIYLLRSDGTGIRLIHEDVWRQTGYDWHWSVSRDGFLFENIPNKKSQVKSYVMSLGGLLSSRGQLTPFHFAGNTPAEVVAVDETSIRLAIRQEGIIMPTELLLERLDSADVPTIPP